jgi:hypothetical protein
MIGTGLAHGRAGNLDMPEQQVQEHILLLGTNYSCYILAATTRSMTPLAAISMEVIMA